MHNYNLQVHKSELELELKRLKLYIQCNKNKHIFRGAPIELCRDYWVGQICATPVNDQ
jgi:hypothetical protein